MRLEAYIRIVSDAATIREIHLETNVPGATIKKLKAKDAQGEEILWNWETKRAVVDPDDSDRDLNALLTAHQSVFPSIKKHHGPGTDIYLEIVTYYSENELPRGLYISAETISLLTELGGALDNDIVEDLAGPESFSDVKRQA